MKQLSTDSVQETNLIVVLLQSELLGVLLDTVHFIILNLRKLTSHILLVWKLSFLVTLFNAKDYF